MFGMSFSAGVIAAGGAPEPPDSGSWGPTANPDDGEWRAGANAATATALNLGERSDGLATIVGVRFRSVAIPQGATIVSAHIQFTSASALTGAMTLNIGFEDSVSPADLGGTQLANRDRTTARVLWSVADWGADGESGAAQKTPDIKTVVQEIVNKGTWSSGNNMMLLMDRDASDEGSNCRSARSHNHDPDEAGELFVEWTA